MEGIRSKCNLNPIINLSKYTSNRDLLSSVTLSKVTINLIVKKFVSHFPISNH